MTKKQYGEYVKTKSKNSPIWKNMLLAFLVGGSICAIGQYINSIYEKMGMSTQSTATATSITLIFIGALLTGLDLYHYIARFAGAGTIVPITGFANSIVSPAMEFKSEGLVMGVGAKMFAVAGPVIVYGTVTSIIYGIILFILSKI